MSQANENHAKPDFLWSLRKIKQALAGDDISETSRLDCPCFSPTNERIFLTI
jgi:hypothetical protein